MADYRILISDDYGANWDAGNIVTPFDVSTHKPPVACGLAESAIAAAAYNKDTGNVEFSVSFDDGASWNDVTVIGAIDIGSKTSLSIYQEHMSGGSRIIVTNGFDFFYQTSSYGTDAAPL